MRRATMAVGVFDDPRDAGKALDGLRAARIDPSHIDVLALQTPDVPVHERHRFHPDETTGILAGGMLGGAVGWLIGAATVAVPGVGALLAAGALVGALGGAGIGAAAGGLLGHLVDRGLTREEADYYHERVRAGAVLVIVRDHDRADDAHRILHQHHAHEYATRPTA